jgi:hypothetical protein
MRFFSKRLLFLATFAVIGSLIVPAGAQTPLPDASPDGAATPAPLCPPAQKIVDNVTWTFYAPNQTCSTTIRSAFAGTVTFTDVDGDMVAVNPTSGISSTPGFKGAVFVVTSLAKAGRTTLTMHYANERTNNSTVVTHYTIINKY